MALEAVVQVRGRLGLSREGVDNIVRKLRNLGRPAVEVKGWILEGGEARRPFDSSIFDVRSGLIVVYINYENSSRRKAGEAIQPLSAASVKADYYLGLLYPENSLVLESVRRLGVRGEEGVYYEIRYSPLSVDIKYYQPLVRMLIDASTGNLYLYEMAADYLDSGPVPKVIVSREAAEKIAAVNLRKIDLAAGLGKGKTFVATLPAELALVRPNNWLGTGAENDGTGARLAWVVPFRARRGNDKSVVHRLFVEAATGKVIGGEKGPPE